MNKMKFKELIDLNVKKVREYEKEDAAIFRIMLDVTRLQSYELYAKLEDTVNYDIIERVEKMVDQYVNGIPVQHILGYETFFGRDFIVNEDVLIPRFETEELVENILYHIDDYFEAYDDIDVVDIGTGSGAIIVTLACEEPAINAYATDISQEALVVANDNAKKHDVKVTLYQGDMLQPIIDKNMKVDILVSNPPYIPQEQYVEPLVKDNEPHVALFGGNDGLNFYRQIFAGAQSILKDRALMAFEFGYDQKEALEKEVKHYFPNYEYEFLQDAAGKDRMLFIYKNIER